MLGHCLIIKVGRYPPSIQLVPTQYITMPIQYILHNLITVHSQLVLVLEVKIHRI